MTPAERDALLELLVAYHRAVNRAAWGRRAARDIEDQADVWERIVNVVNRLVQA